MKENAVIMLRSCWRDRDKLPNGKRGFDQLVAGKAGKPWPAGGSQPARFEALADCPPAGQPWQQACQVRSPGAACQVRSPGSTFARPARGETLAATLQPPARTLALASCLWRKTPLKNSRCLWQWESESKSESRKVGSRSESESRRVTQSRSRCQSRSRSAGVRVAHGSRQDHSRSRSADSG